MSRQDSVVVLGGGAAGLSAAWALVEQGLDVVLLEQETSPGGLCRTVEQQGWRFDLGGHRFISQDESLVNLVKGLLGRDLLLADRQSVILLDGRRYQYPLSLPDVMRNLDVGVGLKGVADYLRQRLISLSRRTATNEESFESWTRSRYGQTFYDLFFGPYSEKLWGIPASELSGDWAAQRISLLDLTDVLLRLVGLRRSPTRTYARSYYYPRRGIGQIFQAMAENLRLRGAQIRLGARVVGLGTRAGRVREIFVEDGGRERGIRCDQVITTLPLPDTARMLLPRDRAVSAAASQLRYRGVRFLNIQLDRPDVSANTWMYVPDSRCLFTRIQEPRRRSPENAPPGRTSLMLEIPCDRGDEVWAAEDQALLDRCLHDLDGLGIRVAHQVLGCFSTRVTHGYPVFRLGYRAHRDRLLEAAGRFSNLVSCGRQATFRYIFMDTAMQMGFRAAQQIIDQRRDAAEMLTLHDEPALLEARAVTA